MQNRVRGWWFVAAGACAAMAGLAAGLALAFTGGAAAPQAAGARQYSDFQACLLTGERGLADPAAAPLWAGMEQASLVTHARVSYLAVAGPQTAANALPVLGSLLVQHCGLVLAAGQAEREAVAERAREYPSVKFAVRDGAASAVSHAAGG
jgi:basic membrane lipoprotein Med (substrate-binding protein (PBP1-ABC) superfamily)